jgi:hypothetical protein
MLANYLIHTAASQGPTWIDRQTRVQARTLAQVWIAVRMINSPEGLRIIVDSHTEWSAG